MSPELRQLRYFIAVAEELSYTRAAKRVNVVPQALSTAVQQLEHELGVQLLIRTTRKVELTEAGRALLEGGRAALDTVERSWSVARLAGGRPRELRVAYTYSAGYGAVPLVNDAVVERLHDVSVTWWETWCDQAVAGVATGRFDLGMARYPERLRHLAYETVAEEPQVVVVGARHELAEAGPIGLADLAGETILMFPREMAPGYHDALLAMLGSAELRTTAAPDTGHARVNLSLIASGRAIAVVPTATAIDWLRAAAGELALVPLDESAPRVPLDVFWNPQTTAPVVEELVGLIRELGAAGSLAPVG